MCGGSNPTHLAGINLQLSSVKNKDKKNSFFASKKKHFKKKSVLYTPSIDGRVVWRRCSLFGRGCSNTNSMHLFPLAAWGIFFFGCKIFKTPNFQTCYSWQTFQFFFSCLDLLCSLDTRWMTRFESFKQFLRVKFKYHHETCVGEMAWTCKGEASLSNRHLLKYNIKKCMRCPIILLWNTYLMNTTSNKQGQRVNWRVFVCVCVCFCGWVVALFLKKKAFLLFFSKNVISFKYCSFKKIIWSTHFFWTVFFLNILFRVDHREKNWEN